MAESLYTSPQMQHSINVSNALRYNFYTCSLLYGTNIATIYYFPNKRQHFFPFFLRFFTNHLIINEVSFLSVCYMLFKPLSYTLYIFIYISKIYHCFLFRKGKNKCQYSTIPAMMGV